MCSRTFAFKWLPAFGGSINAHGGADCLLSDRSKQGRKENGWKDVFSTTIDWLLHLKRSPRKAARPIERIFNSPSHTSFQSNPSPQSGSQPPNFNTTPQNAKLVTTFVAIKLEVRHHNKCNSGNGLFWNAAPDSPSNVLNQNKGRLQKIHTCPL